MDVSFYGIFVYRKTLMECISNRMYVHFGEGRAVANINMALPAYGVAGKTSLHIYNHGAQGKMHCSCNMCPTAGREPGERHTLLS